MNDIKLKNISGNSKNPISLNNQNNSFGNKMNEEQSNPNTKKSKLVLPKIEQNNSILGKLNNKLQFRIYY
jgi:hypothetical protein